MDNFESAAGSTGSFTDADLARLALSSRLQELAETFRLAVADPDEARGAEGEADGLLAERLRALLERDIPQLRAAIDAYAEGRPAAPVADPVAAAAALDDWYIKHAQLEPLARVRDPFSRLLAGRSGEAECCLICRKYAGAPVPAWAGLAKPAGGHLVDDGTWLVGHGPTSWWPAGTLLIESRRHFPDHADLDDAEAAGLGPLLRRLTGPLKQATGAPRIHVYSCMEGTVHFHTWMVPRTGEIVTGRKFLGDPGSCTEAEAEAVIDAIRELMPDARVQEKETAPRPAVPAPAAAACFPFADHPGPEHAAEYASLTAGPRLAPVTLRDGTPALLAHRVEDTRRILTDPAFSRQAAAALGMTARSTESLALNAADPPDHTRRRRLVAAAFTAPRAAELRPTAESVAGELLTAMTGAGAPADLISAFALPFATRIVCTVMGIDPDDVQRLKPAADRMMCTTAYPRDEVEQAHRTVYEFFETALDRPPGSNRALMAEIAEIAREGEQLSLPEGAHLASGLLLAGYETTANQIGMCALLLARDREFADRLRREPAVLAAAIEEMLRDTSLLATGAVPHLALRDVDLGDGDGDGDSARIEAGQVVIPAFDAANSDPAAFPEPGRLDIDRTRNSHLAFGHGRHACLGAPLARMELHVALSALLERLPGLRLAVPEEELRWRDGMFIRGVWELPVAW